MEIASKYDPSKTEERIYAYWMEKGFFSSQPDEREPYTIVIPPPNVTGVLHMGHMLNNTLQDVLVRRARMQGKNACWVPGTDHASIATEAKVVEKLKAEGMEKNQLSREEFLRHCWEWTEKHGGIILEQLKKLGASCDWDRTCFTMDEARYESVIEVFVNLYNKGKIYRGVRMINWDPQAKTAISDEEVNYREENSKLFFVRYKVYEEDNYVTIATTRPETILGDTAICYHPQDKRFKNLKGKRAVIPLIDRVVPIIEDEYVDMEFGTGCLKITPAHDVNDYEIGIKHSLEIIDIFNDDGTLNEKAELFIGEDRFKARELIEHKLLANGYLVKVEDYVNKVGFSERTDAAIEPKLSMQWFLKMKELAKPALENVMNDIIHLVPVKFKNTYKHWMENVKDWCISRQLWWGHRIPAYYLPDNNDFVVAKTPEEAVEKARQKTGNDKLKETDLTQDEDVLDTWFSSWLWPISVFDGIRNPDNKDIRYYYPTNDMITAPEILFFWVARMIISGYEYRDEKPFKNIYLHGIVRDVQRRKMSKSLGNSPDPLKLMEKYSADGVRVGMLLCSPAGNDLLFDESLPEQGRNFTNKIWNAFRLVKSWKIDNALAQPQYAISAIAWFDSKLNQVMKQVDKNYSQYRISEALMNVYRLFWEEFSSWYLDIIKPAYQQPIDAATYESTIAFFEKLLQLLHPFMPFITEEIWHLIEEREENDSIMVSRLPKAQTVHTKMLDVFDTAKLVVSSIRTIRKEKNIQNSQALDLSIKPSNGEYDPSFEDVIIKLCNLSGIHRVDEKIEGAVTFIIKSAEYYLLLGDLIDKKEEIQKLEKELHYTRGFLSSVMKKLNNRQFVANAPSKVVELETKKRLDTEAKIKILEDHIGALKGS